MRQYLKETRKRCFISQKRHKGDFNIFYTILFTLYNYIIKMKEFGKRNNETPTEKLRRLQDDFSEWLLRVNPEFATMFKDPRYNDKLDDYSLEEFDRWKVAVDKYLKDLKKIKKSKLSAKEQIDYDIFKDFLMTYHDGYKWRMYNALNPINYMEGPHCDPATFAELAPKETKENFENFIKRIESMPQQLLEMEERFRKAIEVNHTSHKVSIASVPEEIKDLLKCRPEDFPLYTPFKDDLNKLTDITDQEKINLRMQAKSAVEKFMDGLQCHQNFINETYLKHTRTSLGVDGWDNGSEYYKACLKWHTSLNITPEEVHQKGLEEVKRIANEMKKIFTKLGISGSIKEGFQKLKNDPKFFLPSKEAVVEKFTEIIQEDIQPKLSTMFKDIPEAPVKVQPLPIDGPCYYNTGTATFFVNASHPEEMPTFGFPALALHESIPGHHFQYVIQAQSDSAGFRRFGMDQKYFQPPTLFPFYTAYVEGWALYAEYLGEEMGMYDTEYKMLGRYSEEIFRACRLVVDTGLHSMGWSREKAFDFMSTYSAKGEKKIYNEINRYVTWPGQACAYKIGELKIKEFRAKAEKVLGNHFNIKDFHAVLLNNGPMPLSTLETIVDQWIEDVQSTKPYVPNHGDFKIDIMNRETFNNDNTSIFSLPPTRVLKMFLGVVANVIRSIR